MARVSESDLEKLRQGFYNSKTVEDLYKDFHDERAFYMEAVKIIAERDEQIATLQTENNHLKQQVASLQYALGESDKEYVSLKKKLATAKARVAELEGWRTSANGLIKCLEATREEARVERDAANIHAEKAYALSEQYAGERDAARAALRALGTHSAICDLTRSMMGHSTNRKCTCGLEAALSGETAAQLTQFASGLNHIETHHENESAAELASRTVTWQPVESAGTVER